MSAPAGHDAADAAVAVVLEDVRIVQPIAVIEVPAVIGSLAAAVPVW